MSVVMSSRLASKADPNLTPLLDVVFQLLMFFIMCVNFVAEQVTVLVPTGKREPDAGLHVTAHGALAWLVVHVPHPT